MTATKQKSKKSTIEPIEDESVIAAEINTIDSKKSAIVQTGGAIDTKETVDADEGERKTAVKKSKPVKTKVIRDSFSFPEQDYLKISELKKTCLAEGIHVKKGEILRAGLHLLSGLNLVELKQVVEKVEKVQTGRPNASKV